MSVDVIERHESEVRTYCRSFPAMFDVAEGSYIWDVEGNRYLDFLAGAGSLNYGHNDPTIRAALIDHLTRRRICQSLDLFTTPKSEFLSALAQHVLEPRGLGAYKVQFVGPTGANSVEAALKLARKVTKRTEVVAFTNGFHGVSLGALAACGEVVKREAAGVPLGNVVRAAFDKYYGPSVDTIEMLEKLFDDPNSGIAAPAAFLVETVQGEGGLNVASPEWLRRLSALAKRRGALLIVDEIQSGCGRTGDFFGFEESGIAPDLICVSKSISGFGLPLSLVLIKPEFDAWAPGEHNGTFRGSNLSFAAATTAILNYWRDGNFLAAIRAKAALANERLEALAEQHAGVRRVGRGLMLGLRFDNPAEAEVVSQLCFGEMLIVETCGPRANTLKLLPPLTIAPPDLEEGIAIIGRSLQHASRSRKRLAEVA